MRWIGFMQRWWRRVLSQPQQRSAIERLPQWVKPDDLIYFRGDRIATRFVDEAGDLAEAVEPGSPNDPFTVLHAKEHSFSAMWYYLGKALSAVEEGDCKQAESLLIQARGKAVDAHSLPFPKEDKGQ